MDPDPYPLYATAIILPALAFPAWILCIPPLVWHYSQQNIAAWSLILWIILMNVCNAINPLIWPRDNVEEWFSGNVLCDIEVRIFVGCSVAFASCTAMVFRKLAKVMDTRNITIAPSRNTVIREKALEGLWCWGYPVLIILVYYIVQPVRYFIYGISGCVVAYNLSWVSIVLSAMWEPITVCVAAYYGGLLIFRLYRYRREFHRLIAARDTTKSRFIRLFVMSLILFVILVPYSFWILWLFASTLNESFSWSEVHGPGWNTVIKVPAAGEVRLDKWGQIGAGYITFLVYGTGTDANNLYKRYLCAIGLGKLFPSLYNRPESGTSSPGFQSARGWCSSCASKARTLFSINSSVTETMPSRNDSVALDGIMPSPPGSASVHPVSTNDPILSQHPAHTPHNEDSLLGRLFTRRNHHRPILPLFAKKTIDETDPTEKSPTDTCSSGGVHAHAWASDSPTASRSPATDGEHGVYVVRELHQEDNLVEKQNP